MKIGAIGTSFIMDTILENMAKTEGINCEAIFSRTYEKGKALADKFNIGKVYTSLDDMLADEDLDWIYVCSPNSVHYEQSKQALLAGKHVLCEKPFTTTSEELKELISIAKEKHLYLFEAILPMFHPNYKLIKEYLPLIGNVKMANGTFCQYSSRYEALLAGDVPNVFNPKYSGGCLMDLNMYNVYFMVGLFGKPESVEYHATLFENGIDTNGILYMKYPDFMCQCTAAKDAFCENNVQILGDKGYIKVTPTASTCQEVTIVRRKEEDIHFEVPENPWLYEMIGLADLVSKEDFEECYRKLDIALQVMEVLEEARKSAGLPF